MTKKPQLFEKGFIKYIKKELIQAINVLGKFRF